MFSEKHTKSDEIHKYPTDECIKIRTKNGDQIKVTYLLSFNQPSFHLINLVRTHIHLEHKVSFGISGQCAKTHLLSQCTRPCTMLHNSCSIWLNLGTKSSFLMESNPNIPSTVFVTNNKMEGRTQFFLTAGEKHHVLALHVNFLNVYLCAGGLGLWCWFSGITLQCNIVYISTKPS